MRESKWDNSWVIIYFYGNFMAQIGEGVEGQRERERCHSTLRYSSCLTQILCWRGSRTQSSSDNHKHGCPALSFPTLSSSDASRETGPCWQIAPPNGWDPLNAHLFILKWLQSLCAQTLSLSNNQGRLTDVSGTGHDTEKEITHQISLLSQILLLGT